MPINIDNRLVELYFNRSINSYDNTCIDIELTDNVSSYAILIIWL